jgi:biopolymer transport protein TolQ
MSLAALPLASVFGDVMDLIIRSGVFAKFIILLLATLSIFSWAIMLQRARAFARAERENVELWRRFALLREGQVTMGELGEWSAARGAPLPTIFRWFQDDFWPAYLSRRGGGAEQSAILLAMLRRGVDRSGASVVQVLERPLGWLATFATVAPFLGLLGTVWGIMNSFLQLGAQGSATLDVVGPGIAEALITTVAGLGVAIPSVVGYNYLVRQARAQENEVRLMASVLSDLLSDDMLKPDTTKV